MKKLFLRHRQLDSQHEIQDKGLTTLKALFQRHSCTGQHDIQLAQEYTVEGGQHWELCAWAGLYLLTPRCKKRL